MPSQTARQHAAQAPADGYTLDDLLFNKEPDLYLVEIRRLLHELDAGKQAHILDMVAGGVIDMFRGRHPAFGACNTGFHDLDHTMSVSLAMARIMHGASLNGTRLSPHAVLLGMLAALFHDIGYLQDAGDTRGTGAKHTIGHEERSITIMGRLLSPMGFRDTDIDTCARLIRYTNIAQPVSDHAGDNSQAVDVMGRMLGSCDLLAQMADRLYLEKLLCLYREFDEAGIPGYASEIELLQKTPDFYAKLVVPKLENEYGGVRQYMLPHFTHRWNLDHDYYSRRIEVNMGYLDKVLQHSRDSYRALLRRGGIVDSLEGRLPEHGHSCGHDHDCGCGHDHHE
jgi:hypothetical protein